MVVITSSSAWGHVITMRYTHKFYVTHCNILKYSHIIYDFDNFDGKTDWCKQVNSEIPIDVKFWNFQESLFTIVQQCYIFL